MKYLKHTYTEEEILCNSLFLLFIPCIFLQLLKNQIMHSTKYIHELLWNSYMFRHRDAIMRDPLVQRNVDTAQ
jgi:hypothetical protein